MIGNQKLPQNAFVWYSERYKCSIAEAIADRDWPANKAECIKMFVEATGREPTQEEIIEMRADTQANVDEWIYEASR